MSKRGSNSELFAHENDALTARPQLFHMCVIYDIMNLPFRNCPMNVLVSLVEFNSYRNYFLCKSNLNWKM